MPNLVLTINNGKFEEANGAVVNSFAPTKVIGLGWIAQINKDGTLEASSREKIEEGTYFVKVILKNGEFVLTKKIIFTDGQKKDDGVERYKIPGIDGVLILSDGNIKEKYAYHMHRGLINFQKSFSIKKIERSDPNQIYKVSLNTVIYTDGKCSKTVKSKDMCLLDVKEASWVIIEPPTENSNDKNRILYTKIMYNKIQFPEILSSSGRVKITRSLKKDFESVKEALEYVKTLNLFKTQIYYLEEYAFDESRVNVSYFLDSDGFLKVYMSRTSLWNTRESLEVSGVDTDLVKEGKDFFSKTDRFLEGVGYVE